jgi:hypothetical protein
MYFNIEAELGSQIQYQFSQESLDIGWDMSRYGWSHSRLFRSRWEFMFQKECPECTWYSALWHQPRIIRLKLTTKNWRTFVSGFRAVPQFRSILYSYIPTDIHILMERKSIMDILVYFLPLKVKLGMQSTRLLCRTFQQHWNMFLCNLNFAP